MEASHSTKNFEILETATNDTNISWERILFGGKVWTKGKRPYMSLLTREIVSRKIGRPYFTLRIHNYLQSELLHP